MKVIVTVSTILTICNTTIETLENLKVDYTKLYLTHTSKPKPLSAFYSKNLLAEGLKVARNFKYKVQHSISDIELENEELDELVWIENYAVEAVRDQMQEFNLEELT